MKVVIIFFLITSFIQVKAQYKNIVLEGGGIRGTAFAGALQVLEDKNIIKDIENVLGTSSGSMVGMLIALGYTPKEIDSITLAMNIKKFDDRKFGYLGKALSLKKHWGGIPGEFLYQQLKKWIYAKTNNENLTFAQLDSLHKINKNFKNLFCVVTNLNNQTNEVFSNITYPNMCIALAVRASCSIPVYFEPVALNNKYEWIKNKKDTTLTYYVDGGIAQYFALHYFDTCKQSNSIGFLNCYDVKPNLETIGLKLERNEQEKAAWENNSIIAPFKIKNFKDYSNSIINIIMEQMNRSYPNLVNEKGRVIYISIGSMATTIRKVSEAEKKYMFENSYNAGLKFFEFKK